MENKNEEMQRVSYENYIYKQQLSMLRSEMEKITLTMLDLSNASKTISSLEIKESLVPIGGNAFVEAKVSSENILVPIGGGYLLRMDRENSRKEMEKRTESTKKIIERLQKEYELLSKKLTETEKRLHGMRQ
ncbi:MAG: prefoldin subunit alpha [Candidatus Micrarchaeia archaeon]